MPKTEPQKAQEALNQDSNLGVVVLSVGDGDSIVVRFPPAHSPIDNLGNRKTVGAVVDCYNAKKTKAALTDLGIDELAFVCATHPHADHIRGLESLIKWCVEENISIHQFWDSGFRHVSKMHYDLIKTLRLNPEIKFICPTSGFELYINRVRVQVLSPSILLRNRYDTFGTNINNASIVMKLDYPAADIAEPFGDGAPANSNAEPEELKQNTIILGGDAQFDAWARITEEFPHLVPTSNRYQLIDPDAKEHKPLKCQILKVPHHMSKHGVSLEVMEILRPIYSLASCANKSRHGFPHELTVMAAKDIKSKKTKDKGIRYTGHKDPQERSGTLVAIMKGDGYKPRVFELGETAAQNAPLG